MKSEQIQLEGECDVSVESEPLIVTEQSYQDRHDTEIQKMINPMAEDEFEKDHDPDEDDEGCTEEETDAMIAEDTGIDQEGPYDYDEDAIRDIPTALSSQGVHGREVEKRKRVTTTFIPKHYDMAPRGFNREYYDTHPNPHNVDYKTFLRRVYRLHISRRKALSYPNLGRGGDRKTDNIKQVKNTISITYIINNRDCL